MSYEPKSMQKAVESANEQMDQKLIGIADRQADNKRNQSIPEADIPLQKRARFTTPTGGYEIGESSVVAAARQIRPTLTIAESRRADDRLIGRLRRERRYFCTLSTTYAKEVAHFHDYYTQIIDYCQSREDSDSLRDEIDLSLTPDDSMPPSIEDDDYDSEGDMLILEELLSNDSFSLPENESFHFDIPSSTRPPAKPPDDDEIEPNSGILTIKVVSDISEHYVPMPRLLPTQPTLASN
nr:hypothetical protein [Tanacetum cinerariifolium]